MELALLIDALWRLIPYALEGVMEHSLTGAMVCIGGLDSIYGLHEGYRGFQLRFRKGCGQEPIFEPLRLGIRLAHRVAMGLFHATRRRMITTWILISGIIVLILLIRQLDQLGEVL